MPRDKYYKPGDYYIIDDIRGHKVRASDARLQWDNAFTLPGSFSPRQPQDLVVGVRDDQSVPLPRPRQKDNFTILATYVVAPSLVGSRSITVQSTVGFTVGDLVQVMLDSGVPFQFRLRTITGNILSWATGAALPASVGALYGNPIENQVLDLFQNIPPPAGFITLDFSKAKQSAFIGH